VVVEVDPDEDVVDFCPDVPLSPEVDEWAVAVPEGTDVVVVVVVGVVVAGVVPPAPGTATVPVSC